MSSRFIPQSKNFAMDMILGIKTRGVAETNIPDGKHCSTLDYAFIDLILDAMRLAPPDVFVDIGCGRGRALCSAARRPVQEIVGIEGDPEIAAACDDNVRRLRRRGHCRTERMSIIAKLAEDEALDAVWKAGTAYYLFCPFGEKTLLGVAQKIRQLMKRPVRFAYVNPAYEAALATAGFRRTDWWPANPSRDVEHAVSFWEAP